LRAESSRCSNEKLMNNGTAKYRMKSRQEQNMDSKDSSAFSIILRNGKEMIQINKRNKKHKDRNRIQPQVNALFSNVKAIDTKIEQWVRRNEAG
jgi:hypothetical protein